MKKWENVTTSLKKGLCLKLQNESLLKENAPLDFMNNFLLSSWETKGAYMFVENEEGENSLPTLHKIKVVSISGHTF